MRFAWLVAVTACAGSPSDVVGPFTGASHRFVIDRVILPATSKEAAMLGDDLDGDGQIDNRITVTIAYLQLARDATTHGPDMIASGALGSEIEILADDLDAGDRVAVLYHGTPGDQPTPVGGRLTRAGFVPNRTRDTRVPGEAMIRLPIFADADPAVLHVVGLEITLTRDGLGGFDGVVAGGVLVADTADPIFIGITQMIAADPQAHLELAGVTDADHDGVLTRAEVAASPLIHPGEVPDVQLFDSGQFGPVRGGSQRDSVSLGFGIHLLPCATGRCAEGPPLDPCHDRVLDGDETDLDCGGSCPRCPAMAACQVAGDCQTGACDAGRCRAPSCSDGMRDGFESDVDCGGNCAGCALGKVCYTSHDCSSNHCSAFPGDTCLAP